MKTHVGRLEKEDRLHGFTLVELLVVIAIIGVLIALLLPAVQAAREAARRMQCSNNLKQMGLAVHNFHDSRLGLPPYSVGWNNQYASFWVTILPFMEQQGLYDFLSDKTSKFANNLNNSFWDGLNDTEKAQCQVKGFFCPSRRPTGTIYGSRSGGQGGIYGAQGDYAFVNGARRDADASGSGGWFTAGRGETTDDKDVSYIRGPFRIAVLPAGSSAANWQPRDTMSWWEDGTSNQIIVGEKNVPQSLMNICSSFEAGEGAAAPASTGAAGVDCSIFAVGSYWTQHGVLRSFNSGLARGADEFKRNAAGGSNSWYDETGQPHWGGCHPGVVNFLLGDGSVKSVSVTTPTGRLFPTTEGVDPSNSIIGRLGHVSDGNLASL